MSTGLPTHRRYASDRRCQERHEVSMLATLEHEDGSLRGRIENLSTGGACFSTRDLDTDLAPGARVLLRVARSAPDGEHTIDVPGRVTRSEDYFDGKDDVMTHAIAFDAPLDDATVPELR